MTDMNYQAFVQRMKQLAVVVIRVSTQGTLEEQVKLAQMLASAEKDIEEHQGTASIGFYGALRDLLIYDKAGDYASLLNESLKNVVLETQQKIQDIRSKNHDLLEHLKQQAKLVVFCRTEFTSKEQYEQARVLTEAEKEMRQQNISSVADFLAVLAGLLIGKNISADIHYLVSPYKEIAEETQKQIIELEASRR